MPKHHSAFQPEHINATVDDFKGNDGIGRYVFLPGSNGRAHQISEHFDDVTVKNHPRQHNLYLGTLKHKGKKIDVATINTGMGCPSMEIILHELFSLGVKRFIRIGTAGALQPNIEMGDLINAHASVRDENTTTHYLPLEFPAISSLEFASSIMLAAEQLGLSDHLHTGIVHCKSSLYAREFGAGPRAEENYAYVELLRRAGILASEMETAALFIQALLYNHELSKKGHDPKHRVLSGAVLSIVATPENHFAHSPKIDEGIENSILLAIEAVKILALQELD